VVQKLPVLNGTERDEYLFTLFAQILIIQTWKQKHLMELLVLKFGFSKVRLWSMIHKLAIDALKSCKTVPHLVV
jgi:hypothetical protein